MIEFDCEGCGKHLKAPKSLAGRKSKCPHCGAICTIPGLRFGSPKSTTQPAATVPESVSEPAPAQPHNDVFTANTESSQNVFDSPGPQLVEWYYQFNGAQAGPISAEMIIEMLEREILAPSTHVWREGMESWVPSRLCLSSPPTSKPLKQTPHRHHYLRQDRLPWGCTGRHKPTPT